MTFKDRLVEAIKRIQKENPDLHKRKVLDRALEELRGNADSS